MKLVYKKDGFVTKLFACLFFAIFVVMCVIGNSVFAYTFTDTQQFCIDDAISRFESSYSVVGNILLVVSDENGNTYVGVSDDSDVTSLEILTSNNPKNFRVNPSQHSLWFYRYNNTTFVDRAPYGDNVYNILISNSQFSYSPYDIIDYPSGDVVFQNAPQPTLLAGIVEQQEMKPLVEILQILPVVILVVVGLIAIRKAIQWIMTTMRRTIKIFSRKF